MKDLVQSSSEQAETLSGHLGSDFEAWAREVVNLWLPGDFSRYAELGEDRYIVAAIAQALREAHKAGAAAERAANIEKLQGLMPLDGGPILDSARGALEEGIQCIRLSLYASAPCQIEEAGTADTAPPLAEEPA